jgi:hypothetical protein
MLTVKVDTHNAAFDNRGEECALILEQLAAKLRSGDWQKQREVIRAIAVDSNGNAVGTLTLSTR